MSDATPFHFFLVMNSARDPRVLRVNMSQDLQQEVTERFIAMVEDLRPADVEEIPFDGRYKPDSDQVFRVDEFVPHPAIVEAIANPVACSTVQRSNLEDQDICGLMVARLHGGLRTAYIQGFQRHQVIRPAKFSIFLSRSTFERIENPGLTVSDRLTAQIEDTRLYFRSYALVRQVLDLGQHYVAATVEEVEKFFGNPLFDASALGDLRTTTDQQIRQKIGSLIRNPLFGALDPLKVQQQGMAAGIAVTITGADGGQRIVLPGGKRELKRLLKLLDEDYLQSLFDESRVFETNSKRQIR